MSCRTRGISRCPFFHPYVLPYVSLPPVGHWSLKSAILSLILPQSLQVSPPGSYFSPPGLTSALHALNLPSTPQTCPPYACPPGLKSALQASYPYLLTWSSNLMPEICPHRTSGNSPCVLQDFVPLEPLPCSQSTSSLDHSKQGIGYRRPCTILGWLV